MLSVLLIFSVKKWKFFKKCVLSPSLHDHILICVFEWSRLINNRYCLRRRIFNIDTHVGIAAAGLISDARSVAEIARDEASSYR